MAEHSSLNDIFARLDQSKANRAEEENRKRKLEAEAAEQERREKAAALIQICQSQKTRKTS